MIIDNNNNNKNNKNICIKTIKLNQFFGVTYGRKFFSQLNITCDFTL